MFIATLIKPIYIIFLGSIFFYNKSLLKSVKNSLIVIFFISLAYAAQLVLEQKNSIGFLENLQNHRKWVPGGSQNHRKCVPGGTLGHPKS